MSRITLFTIISLLVAMITVACAAGTATPAAPSASSPAAAPTVASSTAVPAPSATSAPAAPSMTAAPTAAATAAAPTGGGSTAAQLAEAGKTVFAGKCAKCHGENGQGITAPANIGPQANLGKFGTAGGLYDYVSTAMPQDEPGTLTPQEYLHVVSFLLVQNKFVQPDKPISAETLQDIPLMK